MNIALTGFMGTGKTAVGKKLAKKLDMKYIDTDLMIEKEAGLTIPGIFKKFGEPCFRDLETKAVKSAAKLDNCVIATGGGVVLRKQNMEALQKNAVVVCLEANVDVIMKRTSKNRKRPLLADVEDTRKKIKEMLSFRKPFYKRADLKIDTSSMTAGAVVKKIIEFISSHRSA
ncbi:MAG: shikimate kinase [bacterium]